MLVNGEGYAFEPRPAMGTNVGRILHRAFGLWDTIVVYL